MPVHDDTRSLVRTFRENLSERDVARHKRAVLNFLTVQYSVGRFDRVPEAKTGELFKHIQIINRTFV